MNKTDITAAATLILSPKPVHVRKKTTINFKSLFRPITAFRIFALFWVKFMSWVEEYE